MVKGERVELMQQKEALAKEVKRDKERARKILRQFPRFNLKRDIFFVHGWSDEANVCWTSSYTETGKDRDPNWEYTIKDWIDKLVINKDEKVHYLKLLRDESKAIISCGAKNGYLSIDIDNDETFYYENFFQFADLLKYKINVSRTPKQEIDIICHSMGGLDSVAAIAIDKENDITETMHHPFLEGINFLITVSTPHQGSPLAKLSDTKISELLLHKSKYINTQGANMDKKSRFIRLVNSKQIRRQLFERVNFIHMFGGGDDPLVPEWSYKIKVDDLGKKNFKIHPVLHLATHSQRMGITQDPRMALEIFKILAS